MNHSYKPGLGIAGGIILALTAVSAAALAGDVPSKKTATVTLVRESMPRVPILTGSIKEPAEELQHYLEAISGARLELKPAREGASGIYVGLIADFPWLRLDGADRLGPEGFLLRSDGQSLFLVGREPRGVAHAVATLLDSLGCRWFFPGKAWEVVPRQKTIAGSWDTRQAPSFALQRKIWYGFGASPRGKRELTDWERHNRMGSSTVISIGHTWHGLDPKTDFDRHPEWFALAGKERRATKPCYSHPEVIRRATQHTLTAADSGARMVSMTPPDGLGYCECERCLAVCRGGKPYQERGTTFARRPDGVVVSVASETLFGMINQVAAAVAEKHPETLIGCYAYSAYSHPPSFKLHPNVFVQTTTAYRRTPLTLAEQLERFQKIGVQSGIRAYFSVYQWDWDYPEVVKGELALPRLVDDLRFYHKHNVQSINAEASCNWGPRGLGYYLAARLMWDVHADPRKLLADFYDKAFGPAALPMERYYVRWLGSYAAVRTATGEAKSSPAEPAAEKKVGDELGARTKPPEVFTRETLRAAYRDLDEAARRVKDVPGSRERVDQLRLYAHYLFLRIRLADAAKARDKDKVREAVREETIFGARLMDTNLVHSRPLVVKEFYRRFLPYRPYLEGTPEWPQNDRSAVQKAAGQGYRQMRTDVPDAAELNRVWAEDKKALNIP